MSSLGENAYVGILNYKELRPPVAAGVNNLQDTCDIGNTTTTDIVCAKLAAGNSHTPAVELSVVGNLAPTLRIHDLPFNSTAELTAFDTNVSLSSVNNHPLNFKTNGAQRIAIDTAGNTSFTNSGGAVEFLSIQGADEHILFKETDIRVKKDDENKNISLGWKVDTSLDNKCVAIGNNIQNTGGECVNIGSDIATLGSTQGKFSIAIGKGAGTTTMGSTCVAIGNNAGNTNQGTGTIPASQSIAIGADAGAENQGGASVAIGALAGNSDQKIECVAIGKNAGSARQQQGSIAIGAGAAKSRQGTNAIAIGYATCPDTQGADSIAIGSFGNAFPAGAVALNAGGIVLTPATTGCFINPIAGGTNPAGGVANSLWYDTGTKEVKYHIP